ncbi:universal stress protein [Halopseudomonas pelagia]|uniref:universal stress protein n=1 Tax=Halopseudomonas pelagia TaxID=553151 RepID=UPI0003B51689|nr:universal stress protein [Halopseudomonas pelagia]
MPQHYILSVDYSDGWSRMLEHLPAITALTGLTHLTLVHVVETFKRLHIEDTPQAAESHLKKLAAQLQQDQGIQVDYRVEQGFAASEIVDCAKRLDADGIIVLNRSHSAGREILRGNIAMNLVRMTRLPLLVVPMDGKVIEPDAVIMLATDGSPSARAAERRFGEFMQRGNHGLVVWVDDGEHIEDTTAQEALVTISGQFDNATAQRLKGEPARELVKAAAQENAALIIIGKRGTTPISDMLLGSTAATVARESHHPVLLVP